MAAKEHITEQIRYHTELLRVFAVFLLAVGGGTVSLFFRSSDYWTRIFTVLGLFSLVVAGIALGYVHWRVRKLVNKLLEI